MSIDLSDVVIVIITVEVKSVGCRTCSVLTLFSLIFSAKREPHTVVRCLECKTVKRFNTDGEYQRWSEGREAWHGQPPSAYSSSQASGSPEAGTSGNGKQAVCVTKDAPDSDNVKPLASTSMLEDDTTLLNLCNSTVLSETGHVEAVVNGHCSYLSGAAIANEASSQDKQGTLMRCAGGGGGRCAEEARGDCAGDGRHSSRPIAEGKSSQLTGITLKIGEASDEESIVSNVTTCVIACPTDSHQTVQMGIDVVNNSVKCCSQKVKNCVDSV